MGYVIAFIVSVAMSLVNLPFYLSDGNVYSLSSMIYCACLAIFSLVMCVCETLK